MINERTILCTRYVPGQHLYDPSVQCRGAALDVLRRFRYREAPLRHTAGFHRLIGYQIRQNPYEQRGDKLHFNGINYIRVTQSTMDRLLQRVLGRNVTQ